MKKDTGIRVKYGVPYFIVRVMAIGMLFLILNTSNILAATESPVVLDLSLNQTTLEQVFRELEKQSGYSIIYKSSEVNLKEVLSVDVSKEPLENVLNKVLRKQGLTYEIKDEHIIIYKAKANKEIHAVIKQQNKKISGVVKDAQGEPMIGVSVLEEGTQNGTITDFNGNYVLEVQNGKAALVFSYIGYVSKKVSIGNLSVVNVALDEDVQRLDDVVVVGYAIGNKRSVSGAVEKVKKEDMNSGVVTEPLDAVKGKVAGVVISNVGGDPTSDMNIRIRGTTSLSGGNDPLVIIDGVFGDLSMLNAISPSDIESLTILKDASETAQYGSRGASGVIVVTTAKGRAGFAQIEYNGLFGVNKVYKNLGMLTADEWRAGAVAMGLSTNDMGASTNWFEEVERSASLTQTHNLSFTSGNDNSNLRASLGVIRRPGLLKNSSSNSYTAKVDASQYAFQKRVKFDLGMFGSRREGDHQFDMYRTIYSAAAYNPTYPNYKNPETGIWDEDKTAIEVYNPLGMLEITNKKIASHVNVNGRVNVEIIKGLNLTGFGSYTYYSLNDRRYIPNDIQQGSMNGNGQAYLKYAERNDLMGNLQLNYAREFGRHSINALALLEAQTQSLFESSTKTSGYETNYFTYNNLKAGANISWGDATSNQDAIDPYQSLSLMAPNGTTLVDGSATTTFYIDSNPNPDLRWEKKYTFDVGVDLAMFQSRLRLTMDYYASTTKDMLYTYTVPVPPFVYTSMLANLGEMTNNGFEVAISGDIIKKKDFSLTVGTNLSFQKNKLKSLSGTYMGSEFTTSKYIQVSAVNAPSLTQYAGVTYLTEGQPLGVFYIPHCNGLVEKEDGKFVYDIADLDGDGKVDLSDSGDRYIAGQALPKVYMGGFVNMRYKDFDLAVQLNGAFGHKIYNGTSLTFNNLSLYPTYNILDGALDKRIYDIKISDYYLENGNYVNIEYITLGYNIPVKKLKIEKYLKSLRLAFSVNNVATITGYSGMTPLINSANVASKSSVSGTLGVDDKLIYPLSRTYSLSLGVKF